MYSELAETKYKYHFSGGAQQLMKASVVLDTLIIKKNGYEDKKIEVSSYIGGLPGGKLLTQVESKV
ncbi:MAG: hypothetical protein HQK83_15495 [Fibrobacteria bacterium]|nr:hypothetical protein [Fibrobacteria bacterium]